LYDKYNTLCEFGLIWGQFLTQITNKNQIMWFFFLFEIFILTNSINDKMSYYVIFEKKENLK